MEARPVRKQVNVNLSHMLVVSLIIIFAFLFISMITKNFNYTVASMITVIVINLSLIIKPIRC